MNNITHLFQDAEKVKEIVHLYEDVFQDLKRATEEIYQARNLENIFDDLGEIPKELQIKEKECLMKIVKVQIKTNLAVETAKSAVREIGFFAEELLKIMQKSKTNTDVKPQFLKVLVNDFYSESTNLQNSIEEVCKILSSVGPEFLIITSEVSFLKDKISSEKKRLKKSVDFNTATTQIHGSLTERGTGKIISVDL